MQGQSEIRFMRRTETLVGMLQWTSKLEESSDPLSWAYFDDNIKKGYSLIVSLSRFVSDHTGLLKQH